MITHNGRSNNKRPILKKLYAILNKKTIPPQNQNQLITKKLIQSESTGILFHDKNKISMYNSYLTQMYIFLTFICL